MGVSGYYLSVYSSVLRSVCLSMELSFYLFVYVFFCLSICLSVCLSICLFPHLNFQKRASRHSGVHFFDISTSQTVPRPSVLISHFWIGNALCTVTGTFFDISTSKSGPRPSVFNTFDLQMCFAPQHRALFPHLDFKVAGDPRFFNTFDLRMCFAPQRRALFPHLDFNGVHFSTAQLPKALQTWGVLYVYFLLGNVLRATAPCTFSTSQLPNMLRSCCVFHRLALESDSRHNGVHFFDIWTSKKCSDNAVFLAFWPQRQAIFHLSADQMAPHPPL